MIVFLKLAESENRICSDQCNADGCMGSGRDECLQCANFRYQRVCIESCSVYNNVALYLPNPNDSMECAACHEECKTSCSGPVSCYPPSRSPLLPRHLHLILNSRLLWDECKKLTSSFWLLGSRIFQSEFCEIYFGWNLSPTRGCNTVLEDIERN